MELLNYLSRELARDIARDENLDIIIPEDNELQLDLDTPEAYEKAYAAINKFTCDLGTDLGVTEFPSRHGNTHMIIKMPFDMNPWQRIALQACFGSDLTRELLSCYRVLTNIEHPTILFRKKEPNNEPND